MSTTQKKPSALALKIAARYVELIKGGAFGNGCDSDEWMSIYGAAIDAEIAPLVEALESILADRSHVADPDPYPEACIYCYARGQGEVGPDGVAHEESCPILAGYRVLARVKGGQS